MLEVQILMVAQHYGEHYFSMNTLIFQVKTLRIFCDMIVFSNGGLTSHFSEAMIDFRSSATLVWWPGQAPDSPGMSLLRTL